jgi:paraquat-inducible protein A
MALFSTDIVACPDCDLLQRIPAIPSGGAARCARCGRTLAAHAPGARHRALAYSVAALILLILANAEPLMVLSASGRESTATILGGARAMWLQGERIAALLVALFVVIMPALEIGFLLTVLLASRKIPSPSWVGTLLRWVEVSGVWSMMEVMLLGILVSLVKIASLARVEPGIGIFAVAALVFVLALIAATFEPGEIWPRVRWANGRWPGGPAVPANAHAPGRNR